MLTKKGCHKVVDNVSNTDVVCFCFDDGARSVCFVGASVYKTRRSNDRGSTPSVGCVCIANALHQI